MSYRRLRDHRPETELLGGVTKRARHWSTPKIPVPPPPPEIKFPELPPIIIGGGSVPELPPPPKPFDFEAAEAKKRRAEELKQLREIERRRKGYSHTLLTGGEGVTEEAPVRRPTLIGS